MPLAPPTSLSPSKVSAFKDCALAFRFSAIDHLPEPPSPAATKGTLVHLALEHLFERPAPDRTIDAALLDLDQAGAEIRTDPDFTELDLDSEAEAAFFADAEVLVRRYFELEDPRDIHPIGLELKLEARIGDLRLRGIIDRLELDADGELVVTDYKSGKAPNERYEQSRLGGVHFYSFLCEELFGKRPARVQLLYLGDPMVITTVPSDQSSRGLRSKVAAIWQAVELACERDDFRPKPSRLCDFCAFKDRCPAWAHARPVA
ncbi:MAG: RecB family exonuclease, partial [Acidimicrobiales bacterium]|nr:RecB family exonuclease [Acidimicrobiales bacterium]